MSAAGERAALRAGPLYRTGAGVVHDPRRPGVDGPTAIRAGLRTDRRFRVTDEETGEDCTVEALAEFLFTRPVRTSGLLDGCR